VIWFLLLACASPPEPVAPPAPHPPLDVPDPYALLLTDLDADASGRIEAGELPAHFAEQVITAGDRDGDGGIDRRELEESLQSWGHRSVLLHGPQDH